MHYYDYGSINDNVWINNEPSLGSQAIISNRHSLKVGTDGIELWTVKNILDFRYRN